MQSECKKQNEYIEGNLFSTRCELCDCIAISKAQRSFSVRAVMILAFPSLEASGEIE